MGPDLKVVQLRNGAPSTRDIAGNLRLLADQIERGELGPFDGVLFLGIPTHGVKPVIAMFGETMLRHRLAGVCTHAAHLILTE